MVNNNPALLEITDAASAKLQEVLAEQDAAGSYLRITVTPGDNGNAQYVLGLESDPADNDTLVDTGAVRALVDADSVPLLEGSSIDYVEGMQRSGFVISNPNFAPSGGCACGGGGCGCSGG